MDHASVARQILAEVGGPENIAGAEHCMTRLRLNLVDSSKADAAKVQAIPGVLGVVNKGGQFQVVLGGVVPKIFAAFDPLWRNQASSSSGEAAPMPAKSSLNFFDSLIAALSGVFVPILPAIIGAGMLKGLLSTLVVLKWVDTTSSTYIILNAISDGAFYFLPVLIAFSGAKKFGMNQYTAAAVAFAALHPTISTLLSGAMKTGTPLDFFHLPVTPANYAASVISMFVTVWVGGYIERFFDRRIHESVRVIFSPMLTILIVVTLFFTIIGPFGAIAGDGLSRGIVKLFEISGILGGVAVAVGWCLMVIVGMHYAMVPIFLQSLATNHYDYILVGATLANIAQGGAAMAVFLRLREPKGKAIALSAGISAFFGVTEPVIYGVNLRYRRPFFAALMGAGIAGGFAMFFETKAYVFVKTGIQGIPMFIGPTFVYAIMAMGISISAAFLIAYFWGLPEQKDASSQG